MGKAPEVHELRQYNCLINMSAEGTNKSNALLANEDFEAEERQEQDAAIWQVDIRGKLIAALKVNG